MDTIDFDALLAPYGTAVAADPGSYVAHLNLGCAYAALDTLESAAQSFHQALLLAPGVPETHYFLGRVYGLQRLHEQAAQVFDVATKRFPDWGQARALLGLAHFNVHRYQEAEDELRAALDRMANGRQPVIALLRFPGIDPGAAILAPLQLGEVQTYLGRVLYATGRMDESEAMYRLALRSGTPPRATYVLLGLLQVQRRRFDDAVESFRAAIRQDPNNARAHYQLGLLHARRGDQEVAANEMAVFEGLNREAALHRAVDDAIVRPKKAKALAALGWERVDQRKPSEAVGYFEWANWHDAHLADVHSGLGYAQMMLGHLDAARPPSTRRYGSTPWQLQRTTVPAFCG